MSVVKTAGEAGETYDYIVCANKALDQSSVAEQIAPAVDENKTTIAIMQNGVGNEDPFRKAFPKTTIISGVVRSLYMCKVTSSRFCSRFGWVQTSPNPVS